MTEAQVKSLFFDRNAVKSMMNTKTHRALSRGGAFCRGVMQKSMRRRKGVSEPGDPPSAHSGELRELVRFYYDPNKMEAIIGPLRFKGGTVPNLLEHGGDADWVNPKTGQTESRKYKARPFSNPALQITIAKLPKLFEEGGSVGGDS